MSWKNFLIGNTDSSRFVDGLFKNTNSLANQAYRNLLSSYDPKSYGEMYQKSFVNPILDILSQQIVPQIKQQFLGSHQWGGSGLNRALDDSIQKAVNTLNQGMMNQYNTQQQLQLGGLNNLLSLASQRAAQNPHGVLGELGSGVLGLVSGGVLGRLGKLLGLGNY